MQANIVWAGVKETSAELLQLSTTNGIVASGHIVGIAASVPYHVAYEIKIDDLWQVQSLSISLATNGTKAFFLQRENGKWLNEERNELPQFKNCIDVDISLTPFTNTLPVNRLKLQPKESQTITVLYCNLPLGEIKPVSQRYTRLSDQVYLYEGLDTGYSNVLMVDEMGIPVHYPGIWNRVEG